MKQFKVIGFTQKLKRHFASRMIRSVQKICSNGKISESMFAGTLLVEQQNNSYNKKKGFHVVLIHTKIEMISEIHSEILK